MTKSYGDIMDKIEMNSDMRARILKNIQNDNYKSKYLSKKINFYDIKDYLIIAACFVFLVSITISIPKYMGDDETMKSTKQMLETPVNIVSYNSAKELSDAIGFEIEDIDVPFNVSNTSYQGYFDELGEIYYTGENQNAIFRKSLGSYDNSGDYTDYNEVSNIVGNGFDITLKGNDNLYNLAIWQKNGFSYSLRFTNALNQEEFVNIINNIQ